MKNWKQLSIVYCSGFSQEKFFWKLYLGSIWREVRRGSY